MKISVVVPAFNSARTIRQTVHACLAIGWPDKEVIVVDDGSTDGTPDIVKTFGAAVRLVRQENGGPAKARNTGWKESSGEICFFTDADCLPRPDVLALIAPHFADARVGGAGGTYGIANPESLLARLIHEEILHRHAGMRGHVDYLGSFNCAYRRAALERVGGFNEEYTSASGEDNDLSYRIRKSGFLLVFEPRAAVGHFHEESLWRYLRRQYRHGFWRMKLYRGHKDMMKGDRYAGLLDFAQPPLALLLLASLPLAPFSATRPACWTVLALYGGLLSVMPVGIALSRRSAEALCLIPVLFPRGIARGLGLVAGILKFGLPS